MDSTSWVSMLSDRLVVLYTRLCWRLWHGHDDLLGLPWNCLSTKEHAWKPCILVESGRSKWQGLKVAGSRIIDPSWHASDASAASLARSKSQSFTLTHVLVLWLFEKGVQSSTGDSEMHRADAARFCELHHQSSRESPASFNVLLLGSWQLGSWGGTKSRRNRKACVWNLEGLPKIPLGRLTLATDQM